jgi:hypothetical protein
MIRLGVDEKRKDDLLGYEEIDNDGEGYVDPNRDWT